MKTKICYKCNVKKQLNEFYKGYSKERDGYSGRCKECAKLNIKENYDRNSKDPEWVEKERQRTREKYHKLKYKGKYKPAAKQKAITIQNYRKKYPERYKASNSSQHIQCPKGSHKHHWNYNKRYWRDIIILTEKEHNMLHTNMIYDQKIFMFRNAQGELLNTKQSHIDLLERIKYESNQQNT